MKLGVRSYELGVIGIFLLLFLFGCGKTEQTKQAEKEIIPVKVSRIELKEFQERLDSVGSIKAKDEAYVFSKVPGKLVEYTVKDGDKVEKGQTIAFIDRDETGLKFELAKVEAPISGIIGSTLLDKGTSILPVLGTGLIREGALAVIVDMDHMLVKLEVPESVIPYLKIGLKADIKVDTYPNENFIGEISEISEVVDPDTRSLPIEITIDNGQHKLKSGMFAKVSLILRSKPNTPVIFKEAILGKEPNNYVYVIENNKAVLKDITVGMRQGPYYEISQGLKAGDLVVIMGQQRLFEGADVRVEE